MTPSTDDFAKSLRRMAEAFSNAQPQIMEAGKQFQRSMDRWQISFRTSPEVTAEIASITTRLRTFRIELRTFPVYQPQTRRNAG